MKYLKHFWLIILRFIKNIVQDNIGLYAAQASFFMIISSIPFIMLLLALLMFFVPINEADVLGVLSRYIPSTFNAWMNTIIDELFNNSSNIQIISVSAISALWLASRGFMALYSGINNVFETEKIPNYFYCRLISLFYTICFLVVLFLAIIMFGFGNVIQDALSGHFGLTYIINIILNMRIVIFITIVTICFSLLYTILAERKIKFTRQFPGALIASLGWMGFSYAYSIYIEYFSNYSCVYGSLTAIVFLMLWLYFCVYIFLLGAEFNKLLEEKYLK